jgi:hypothetical protein
LFLNANVPRVRSFRERFDEPNDWVIRVPVFWFEARGAQILHFLPTHDPPKKQLFIRNSRTAELSPHILNG